MRLVDDGSLASWVYGVSCMLALMCVCWGSEHEVSVGESGTHIRLTDSFETIVVRSFVLTNKHINSPTDARRENWVVRFAPYEFSPRPVVYVRSLPTARMARVEQIVGPSRSMEMIRCVWELFHELHAPPNYFPWLVLREGLQGIRSRTWYVLLQPLRSMVKVLWGYDENCKYFALRHFGLTQ